MKPDIQIVQANNITELNELISVFKIVFEKAYVQSDKEDHHAIDFYSTTNPTSELQVVHFCYKLN